MNILHVISSLDPAAGGPQEGLKQISLACRGLGHGAEVVTLDAPHARWLREFPVPARGVGPGWSHFRYAPGLAPWLRLNAARFDAAVIHGLWQYHGFATRAAMRRSSIPYFVFTHGMLDPWFKRTYPLKHLKKWLYWPWGDYRVLRDATAVLFTCEEEKLLAPQSFWLYRCRPEVAGFGIVAPAVDGAASRARFLGEFPHLAGRRIVLFLGRIHPKKGCDVLVDAYARAAKKDPSLHLVMAGPDFDGWSRVLAARCEQLGIADRVSWTGMLAGELKWGAFHAADAFILPSHQENFGVAVVEAMACRLPVLISNQVNIWREIVADGAGLVESDDVEGTAAMLERWRSLPEAQRADMRERARNCFDARFRIERIVKNLVGILGRGGSRATQAG